MSATNTPLRPSSGIMAESASGVITASPDATTMGVGMVLAPKSRVGVRIVIGLPLSIGVPRLCRGRRSERLDGMGTVDLVAILAAVHAGLFDDLLGRDASVVHPRLVVPRGPRARELVECDVVGARRPQVDLCRQDVADVLLVLLELHRLWQRRREDLLGFDALVGSQH